jgi:hypothetical protein
MRQVKVEATFGTALVHNEHVQDVVERALRTAFGTHNTYAVRVDDADSVREATADYGLNVDGDGTFAGLWFKPGVIEHDGNDYWFVSLGDLRRLLDQATTSPWDPSLEDPTFDPEPDPADAAHIDRSEGGSNA